MTNEEVTQALQDLIGKTYSPHMRELVSQRTGRKRVHGPGDVITKEYDLDRVGISADADGNVSGFSFG